MAKKLDSVKVTKSGLKVSSLKISDLDPNIINGYIHINEAGGRKLGRWKYDKKNNVGIHTNDYKEGEVVGSFDLDLKGIKVNDQNDLFTFSRNSWHCKFFFWLYKVKPDVEFKGMCPYFWLYVFTFFFFYLVIPVVLLRNLIQATVPRLFDWLDEQSTARKKRKKLKFLSKWNTDYKELDPKKALRLTSTHCYRLWSWYLEHEAERHINNLSYKEAKAIADEDEIEKLAQKERLKKIKYKTKEYKESAKESFIIKVLSYILLAFILYVIFRFLYAQVYLLVDFWEFLVSTGPEVGEALYDTGKFLLLYILPAAVIIYLLFIAIKSLVCWISCNIKINISCPKWLISLGNSIEVAFKYIGKGFNILYATIIAIYENNCPRITWKD